MKTEIDTIREARNKLCELELNLCNYDDDDVRQLQNNMFEGVAMLDEALAALAAISTIGPDAIRRECAKAARNAIFDFGIGDKASNYYSPMIRKELAVQLVERAILGTEPAREESE